MKEERYTDILPLWKCAVNELRRSGVTYGSVYAVAWFEQQLSCLRDSMEFWMGISNVRRELENDGFSLSEPGQSGSLFVILPPESNADRMLRYQRHAVEVLGRGLVLGANTRLDGLSESQRRRHEAILERIAKRAALIGRQHHIRYASSINTIEIQTNQISQGGAGRS